MVRRDLRELRVQLSRLGVYGEQMFPPIFEVFRRLRDLSDRFRLSSVRTGCEERQLSVGKRLGAETRGLALTE